MILLYLIIIVKRKYSIQNIPGLSGRSVQIMRKIFKKLREKKGAPAFEYIMLFAIIGLGLVLVLGNFKDKLVNIINNQGDSMQYAAGESYCAGYGKTFSGSFDSDEKPICN